MQPAGRSADAHVCRGFGNTGGDDACPGAYEHGDRDGNYGATHAVTNRNERGNADCRADQHTGYGDTGAYAGS